MRQLAPMQVVMGTGFLTYFPLPCNVPGNCFFGNLFGAELCRVIGFYPKADVLGEGKRNRFIGLGHLTWPQSRLALTTRG